MTPSTDRNRLDEEESPYLRAHADNPVHWQPWDDAALAAARERDVPIFLSVGYAACHWCHVMAEECFEDETIAEILNENFVPVKVDREERPDVDRIYQTICQQVSGRGGWPLSVWLTPEGEPFQVGTYFPPEPQRGMPGFRELLENITSAWADPEQRQQMADRAEQWTGAVRDELEAVPDATTAPDDDLLETAAMAAVRGADRDHGGWGSGPKFPHAGRIHLLLRAFDRTDRDSYREVALEALDAMADGGMYDHVGGGFHRYGTDRDWTVPHFEKMLYDNAELPRAYLAGYQVTGDERYANVARETLAFVERELTHEEGGFFSTLDAQSVGDSGVREEGTFYVWTPAEIDDALDGVSTPATETDGTPEATALSGEQIADLVCERFGVTDRGNFEGQTVLTVSRSIPDLAAEFDVTEAEVRDALDTARERLREVREGRPRPPRDEKVLASWNGLMISAFAEGSLVLEASARGDTDQPDLGATAAAALSFVREHLWDGERLQRRYADGVLKGEGYLEDYAFLARGALDLFGVTGDVDHLAFALDLGAAITREFWDEEAKTLYFTPEQGESLIARPQELTDQSTPSSMGVAVAVLDALDHFRSDETFADIATAVVETHGQRIEANPLQHASLTLAADTVTEGALEVVLVADSAPSAWRAELARRYLPGRLVVWRPPAEEALAEWVDTLELAETPRIWDNRTQKGDEPTVYVCRSRTCSPPRTELGRALDWGERML